MRASLRANSGANTLVLEASPTTEANNNERYATPQADTALVDRDAENERLQRELSAAKEQITALQSQILVANQGESFLTVRDDDYFESACQRLYSQAQEWVARFSKASDNTRCRLSANIHDEKVQDRLDNAILDGSDVDILLADRVERRNVFLSVVMAMIWEYVFTRYLFGLDREQRQKLKSLEKTLQETAPAGAVAQWRAITLTFLSKRAAFQQQCAQDTEAVLHAIDSTVTRVLPVSSVNVYQFQRALRDMLRSAVSLSIEMRTQRAEYTMLPPLQPEYDANGDLVGKVLFNASLMSGGSGETTSDNYELERKGTVVKMVLFPLVVKRGDDNSEEIVIYPAQVQLVASNTVAQVDAKKRTQDRQNLMDAGNTVAQVDAKRAQDRQNLMMVAERKVKARMLSMDDQVFKETGKMSPAMMEDWENKARAKVAADREARIVSYGRVHVRGGKIMDQSEIDAVAAARIQPTLDEINDATEKQRARGRGN
ncbi:hypothetical protein BU16DRAFT_455662 [Lophium mytilinum]|uniref:Uncharacterized protein n=1 Tax=Lophium mytilinum TaxID=390894 RepID=A0A6A6R2J4_9PEZI|nr:hypothetical protein BU16DRAFT_455662 [Lophium mytilinum]